MAAIFKLGYWIQNILKVIVVAVGVGVVILVMDLYFVLDLLLKHVRRVKECS